MATKILLVEDDKPIATALKLKLEDSGYDVVYAEDGAIALDSLKDETFNLILLDLIMPNVDGFEVLEKMKEQNITTPVIILSNLGQDEDIKKAKELGAEDYFIKTDIDLKELIEYIKKQLG